MLNEKKELVYGWILQVYPYSSKNYWYSHFLTIWSSNRNKQQIQNNSDINSFSQRYSLLISSSSRQLLALTSSTDGVPLIPSILFSLFPVSQETCTGFEESGVFLSNTTPTMSRFEFENISTLFDIYPEVESFFDNSGVRRIQNHLFELLSDFFL